MTHRTQMLRARVPLAAAILAAVALALFAVTSAQGASITVDVGASGIAGGDGCSLEEAIQNANDDAATNAECTAGSGYDTITLAEDLTKTAAFSGDNAFPIITDDLAIDGAGFTVARSGVALFRLFATDDAHLSLMNITIENGEVDAPIVDAVDVGGGGLYVEGDLTLDNVTLDGNDVTDTGLAGTFNGGGAYVTGNVSITDSTISNNDAEADGGGFFTEGSVTITGSTFSSNTATGDGGGFYQQDGLTEITDSTFDQNTAASDGGGFLVSGGAFLTLHTLTLTDNDAGTGSGGGFYAGGGYVTLTDAVITGNTAGLDGGGFYTEFGVEMTTDALAQNTVTGNSAGSDGGGFHSDEGEVTLYDTLFDSNTANADGGGFYAYTHVRAWNITVTNNTADADTVAGGDGGGIYVDEYYGESEFHNSLIEGNSAGDGGGIYSGGGILLTNTVVNNNTAADDYGGFSSDYGRVHIVDSDVTNNTATGADYGGFYSSNDLLIERSNITGNTANSSYGGFYASSDSTTIIDSLIAENTATTGSYGGFRAYEGVTMINSQVVDNTAGTDYGGFYEDYGPTYIVDSVISRNTAGTGDYGGFYASYSAYLENVVIDSNTAGDAYGGFYVSDTVILTNVEVTNNEATAGSYGGFYAGGTAILTDSTIDGNTAGSSYGGFYSDDTVSATNSTIDGNTAGSSYGGFYASYAVTLFNSSVSNNEATTSNYGGFESGSGGAYIENTLINGNTAGSSYGGFYISGGQLQLLDSEVVGNTAETGSYGGFYHCCGSTIIDRSLINDNTADSSYGGFYSSGPVLLTDTEVTGNTATTGDYGGFHASDGAYLTRVKVNDNFAGGDYGGFYVDDLDAYLVDSEVMNNTAETGDGGGFYIDDGAAFLTNVVVDGNTAGEDGGGFYAYAGAELIDTQVTNNTTTSATDTGDGGGFHIDDNYHRTLIKGSTITGNSAAGNGGGMYFDDGFDLIVSGSTVADNTATLNGGGIYYDSNYAATFYNSQITGNSAAGNGGGAYLCAYPLRMDYTAVTGNSANNAGGLINGEGGSPCGETFIQRSLVANNTAVLQVGGLFTTNTTGIENTTVTGNEAGTEGGGIAFAVTGTEQLVLANVTVTGNTAGTGGGVLDASTTSTIVYRNSIIRDNTATTGADCTTIMTGTFLSEGYNILGSSCADDGLTDQDVDPMLLALADNGGPTQTMAPDVGSPALEGGNPAGCFGAISPDALATDQRGVARPSYNSICEIGAYEDALFPEVLVVAEGGSLEPVEGETTDSFTVTLSEQPTAGETVTVAIASSDAAQVTTDPTSVVFDESTWNTPQTVTVTAPDDSVIEGDQTYTLSLTPTSSAENSPFEVDAKQVDVTVIEPAPGLIVTQTDGSLAVSEDGGTDTYSVTLTDQPPVGETVTVTITYDDDQLVVSPLELTFDRDTWDTPQDVTVEAVDDGPGEGDHTSDITHTLSSSRDGSALYDESAFSGVTVDVTANIADSTRGVTVSGPVNVTEGGAAESYTVVLSEQPAAGETVTVFLTADPTQLSLSETSLTFDDTTWDTPQSVEVTALNDGAVEGAHTSEIVHVSTSTVVDSFFNGLKVILTANITDADPDANLLTNGSFEAELGPEWMLNGTADIRFQYGNAITGDYVFLFTPNNALEILSQEVSTTVASGDEVTLTAYYGAVNLSTSTAMGVRVTLIDSSGTNPNQVRLCVAPETYQGGSIAPAQITCTVTATAGYDTVLVELGWTGGTQGFFGFDDAVLVVDTP